MQYSDPYGDENQEEKYLNHIKDVFWGTSLREYEFTSGEESEETGAEKQ